MKKKKKKELERKCSIYIENNTLTNPIEFSEQKQTLIIRGGNNKIFRTLIIQGGNKYMIRILIVQHGYKNIPRQLTPYNIK